MCIVHYVQLVQIYANVEQHAPHCGNCRQRRQRLRAAEVGARVFPRGSANLPDLVGHVFKSGYIVGKTPRGHQILVFFGHMTNQ